MLQEQFVKVMILCSQFQEEVVDHTNGEWMVLLNQQQTQVHLDCQMLEKHFQVLIS